MENKMIKITTPAFRVSFPSLWEPQGYENQEAKYQVTALFPATTDISALKAFAKAVAVLKWGDKLPGKLSLPWHNGNDKLDSEGNIRAGYKDTVWIRFTSKKQPVVVDINKQEILTENEIYGGCWARASVSCYAYDKAGNKGVAFGLLSLQKLKDDEPFGGAHSNPDEDFAQLPDGYASTDLSDVPF